MKNKNKRKVIYKRVYSYPEVLGFVEDAHNTLNASIYRFSNDRLHLKAEIVDPNKSLPNWLLCHNIENYVVT